MKYEVFLQPLSLLLTGSSVFPLLPCPCVSVFFILVGFCGFSLWPFLFYVIYFSSESSVCGYHYEYVKDSYIHTITYFFLRMPYRHFFLQIWIFESFPFQSLLSQFVPMYAEHSLPSSYRKCFFFIFKLIMPCF